ncbi:hypothetical protein Tco_1444957 [Tanacetum coccineum]
MNNKKHIVNLEYFREMLQICPKLPNQQFEELPFEEAILTFLRDLGHSVFDYLKLKSSVGMYHKKNVDYAYLLWEDFVYQVENKNVKKSNEMYHPCFTKVIFNFFITKDQSISRRNYVNWHYARDDYMFTTIKVVSGHEDTQLYGAILPNELTNEDIRNYKSYKEYYAIASGAEPPKTKARAAKTAKKKQPAKTSKDKGLTVLSEVALIEAEQIKLAKKRSIIQTHSSHVSDSGADEGTGSIPRVPDVPTYESDDEQISWKSSEEDDDDEVNVSEDDDDDNDDDGNNDDDDDDADNQDAENQDDDDDKTDSDNDGDEFVHPKFSTHDEEDKEEDSFDPRVQTPSHVKLSDDQDSDEEIQDANVEGDKMNEEETNEEAEVDALYRDVNFNLEGRDSEMTDAPQGQQQSSSASSGFVSNMLNPSPDTRIDSLFNLNTESTSLIDVLVTTFAEPPLLSATTLPPPPTPLITQLQQTPVPTPATVPSSSLQDLPNFGSLFRFDHRLKTLETTSQSSIKRINLLQQFLQFLALLMRTLPIRCMKTSKHLFSYNPKDSEMKPKLKMQTSSTNLMTTLRK